MFTVRDMQEFGRGKELWIDVEDNGMFLPPPWQMVVPVRDREVTVGNVMAALLPHVAAAVDKAQPSAPALEWVIEGREARFERNGYIYAIFPDPLGSGDDVAELRLELKGDFHPFEQTIVHYRLNNGSDVHWLAPKQEDFPPVEKVAQGLAMEAFKSLLK